MSESDLLKIIKSIVLQGREILQTFVWSGANKLSPPPNCYPLLPLVTPITPCYLLLPLLPLVTPCYLCYPLLPLLPLITPCYPCYALFQFVTPITLVTPSYPCYPLLPVVIPKYPLLPFIPLVELFWKNSSYVSGVSVCISLWLCNLVTLYVRMFVARANKVEGTISWCLGTNEILAFT